METEPLTVVSLVLVKVIFCVIGLIFCPATTLAGRLPLKAGARVDGVGVAQSPG